MKINRSDQDIHDLLIWCEEHIEQGSTDFEDGTYEEGVKDAVRWLLGATDSRPDQ